MDDYVNTLILVADDSPVAASVVPVPRGGKPTVASIQHALLSERPYALTQGDLLLATWLTQQGETGITGELLAAHRATYFAKPRACLRASPLPKQFGWGLRYDAAGRVALCPMESPEYQALAAGARPDVTRLKAMRRKRA